MDTRARYTPLILALALLISPGCESPPTSSPVPPQADAGEDLRAQVREEVVLNGGGSAAEEGGQLSYAWVQVSGPATVGIGEAGAALATVVPEKSGVYVFRLTVTDGEGVSATDEVYLLVLEGEDPPVDPPVAPPANTPPRAHAGRDLEVEVRQAVVLDGGASFDAEDGQLAYAWVQVSGPATVGIGEADAPLATVAPEELGEYVFRLTVTDGEGVSATDEVQLVVVSSQRGGTVLITGSPVGSGVARVEYLIVGADLDTLRGELIVTDDRVARRTVLAVKAGGNRLVELYAYDGRDRLVAFGSELVRVEDDSTVEVEIALQPLLPEVGEIEVEAVFEDLGG